MAKQKETPAKKITHAEVRMYRMGTGDCFIIKFFANTVNTFTMMIDCGTWQNDKAHLTEFIKDLKTYVNKKIDVLVVTHEHKDHVYGFDVCRDLFLDDPDFIIKNIWMGWTENDNPSASDGSLSEQVKEWKRKFGQHKMALSMAAQQLNKVFNTEALKKQAENDPKGMVAIRQGFADVVNQFAELHLSAADDGDNAVNYVGGLKGMEVVKKDITKKNKITNITYYRPGQIFDNIEHADGIRFYVLGPPTSIDAIQTESGPEGETYSHSHNNNADNDAFATAVLNLDAPQPSASVQPFDARFIADAPTDAYTDNQEDWRRIDHDWLNSAGSLALRMNSATNNLSLALAIEFVDSKRVMLFPGDAEYGSWNSWHSVPWQTKDTGTEKDKKITLAEDLLNRTVFYKVAHHLSHNGSARKRGVEMMNHPELAAMATLDYGRISNGWKNTMPNRDLVQALLTRTKGRLMIMQETGLFVDQAGVKTPLHDKILAAREQMNSTDKAAFDKSFKDTPLYLQYTVKA